MQESATYPKDDDVMTYDYTRHRYVLTAKGVLSELGENLEVVLNASGDANPSTLADRLLRKISQTVYMYLYQDSLNPDWLEYILAKYPLLREWICEMLQAQLLYALTNGFISDYSGVNIAKGHTVDPNWLRGRARIAPEVEDIANRFIPGLGYSLKYCGLLPIVPRDRYHRGY